MRGVPEGALALDLLNTSRLSGGRLLDSLATPGEVLAWLDARALLRRGLPALRASPPDASLLLTEAHRLRTHIGHALRAFQRGDALPPAALHGIDRVLAASRTTRRIALGPGGARLVERETGTDLLATLAPVALAAAGILMAADPARLRRCASPRCSLWFTDTSRSGRRKWCSMDRCGNRAKAERHRRKGALPRSSGR
jgi:predicted RNA-binding Zn ribbon-like protein